MEVVNQEIVVRGDEKVAILEDLRSINKTLLFSGWENSSIEMKATHRQEELAELQCMHLTRDQQVAIRDPEAGLKIDHEQGLLKLIRGSTQSFQQQVEMRRMQLDKIAERLSAVLGDGEGVTQMKQEAETSKDQAEKIVSGLSHNKQDGMKAFKSIVSNTQLKTIAKEQAAEIQALRLQLEKLKAANFPHLPVAGKEEAKLPPDFRLPPLSSRPASRSTPMTASPQAKS